MMDEYCVKILTPESAEIYKNIRLEALKTNPEAFLSTYIEEITNSIEEVKKLTKKVDIFGIFHRDRIVGSAILEIPTSKKLKHSGNIFSFYITPDHRIKGAGSKLINNIIDYSKQKVMQLCLYCSSENIKAINFYKKHGFIITGIYPRDMKDGDKFYDSNIMFLKLD